MALYLGKDLVSASSGLGGATIKNQDKTFTENGSYSADSGYTGLGVVKVDVQPKNQDKNITANGKYTADSGYTGLGEVTVDVPPTPPNNQDITVKENGTYTAENGYTGLGTVTVDVPTGGGSVVSVSPKDVNFYDYDGTLLHSYTVEEAQELTELPELPTQKGLICQGWNWALEDIKAEHSAVNVGATYITDDGKTRIYIRIPIETKLTVPLHFIQSEDNGVTIDWGDGSAKETFAGEGVQTSHTYASIGDYVISLDVADTCTLKTYMSPGTSSLLGTSKPYLNMLYRFECGKNIKLNSYGFSNCSSLKNITISNGAIDGLSPTHLFNGCYSLLFVTIPRGATNINMFTFGKCSALKGASLPNTVTVIQSNLFYSTFALASAIIPSGVTKVASYLCHSCYPLLRVIIPNGITSIPAYCFYQCTACGLYDFTKHTSVPTLANTNAFSGIPSDCQIRVPASLYDEWIAATNWSTYASNIVAV